MKAEEALELSYDAARKDIDDVYKMVEDAAKLRKLHIQVESLPDIVWHSLKKDGYLIEEISIGPVHIYVISWGWRTLKAEN